MAGDRDVRGGAGPNYESGNREKKNRWATNSGGVLRSKKKRQRIAVGMDSTRGRS